MNAAGGWDPAVIDLEFEDVDEGGGMEVRSVLARRTVERRRLGKNAAKRDDGGEVCDGGTEIVGVREVEAIDEAEGGDGSGEEEDGERAGARENGERNETSEAEGDEEKEGRVRGVGEDDAGDGSESERGERLAHGTERQVP